MKFYPGPDVWFYVDKPGGWDKYDTYDRRHSWKLHDKTNTRIMRYWRDIEGSKLPEVQKKDLYFDDWPKSRIRPQACLGMLYATGYRFIQLSKAPPAGFKCAPLPVNLATARIVKKELRKKKKAEAKARKKAKREAKAAAKLAKQKPGAKKQPPGKPPAKPAKK